MKYEKFEKEGKILKTINFEKNKIKNNEN